MCWSRAGSFHMGYSWIDRKSRVPRGSPPIATCSTHRGGTRVASTQHTAHSSSAQCVMRRQDTSRTVTQCSQRHPPPACLAPLHPPKHTQWGTAYQQLIAVVVEGRVVVHQARSWHRPRVECIGCRVHTHSHLGSGGCSVYGTSHPVYEPQHTLVGHLQGSTNKRCVW